MWVTKKMLKKENAALKLEIKNLESILECETATKRKLLAFEEFMSNTYPFDLGQKVYDVQLRSSKGRFTKTKASRQHSLINEVIVDKKNYFNLVERYAAEDVFKTLEAAEAKLDAVCIE